MALLIKNGTLITAAEMFAENIVIWDARKKVGYGVEVAQHRTDYNRTVSPVRNLQTRYLIET